MDFGCSLYVLFCAGIIPNSFAHIFGHIAKADDNIKFLVRVSYLEIYNEEVRDLLGKDQSLRLEVKERPGDILQIIFSTLYHMPCVVATLVVI